MTRLLSSSILRPLLSIGLFLLALWLLHPLLATVVYNNLGSLRLNRALLAPDLPPQARLDTAVAAGQAFQEALAWDPLNGQAYYNLGTLYSAWDDVPASARARARSATLNPRDSSSRFALGQALAARGNEARALEEWRAANAALYFVNRGQALVAAGDLESGLAQFQRALAIDPALVEGHYHLGRTLSALGREEEALAALERAATLEPPDSPRRYLLQAEVHIARQEWTAALATLGRAADVAPQDPLPHYRMGWLLYHRLDDPAAAIPRFERALQLAPDYAPPRQELGQLYAAAGACDAAARWLEPWLAADADVEAQRSAQAHSLLGDCLSRSDRHAEALPHLERALALEPRSIPAHMALAATCVQLRRYDRAIQLYRDVLALQPDHRPAQEALQALGWSEPAEDGP